MTISELLKELSKAPDKNANVYVNGNPVVYLSYDDKAEVDIYEGAS